MITFADIERINSEVNKLPFVNEIGDDWTPITDEGGDCDSYATSKYEKLVALGCPKDILRLATCWVETGEYHAVLLVNYEEQTWVLDNRHPYPTEYQLLPYKWHKLQDAGTSKWEYASDNT